MVNELMQIKILTLKNVFEQDLDPVLDEHQN